MPENEFEKQVQQKMDELNFVPSGTVWKQVEKQIAGRKKRRRIFIWLPFLFLAMGGAAWMFYSRAHFNAGSQQHDEPVVARSQTNTTGKAPVEASKEIKALIDTSAGHTIKSALPVTTNATVAQLRRKSKIAFTNIHTAGADSGVRYSKPERLVVTNHAVSSAPAAGYGIGKSRSRHTQAMLQTEGSIVGKKAPARAERNITANVQTDEAGVTEREETVVKKDQLSDIHESIPAARSKTIADKPATDTAAGNKPPAVAKTVVPDSITDTNNRGATPVGATNKRVHQKSKPEWGIDFTVGASGVFNGLSQVSSFGPSYTAASPANSSTGFTGGDAAVKTGLTFSAGVVMRKKLGSHYRITAALGYRYASTRTPVGTKIDSAAVAYRPGNTGEYTSRFHFITLPVTVEKQLGGASRFSIHAGMAFSLLAGSSMLQYSAQKNIYGIDNSSIRKTQVTVLAGIHYRLVQHAVVVETGPQLDYSLSNLFKKDVNNSSHFIFAGINTKIYFPKKKPSVQRL